MISDTNMKDWNNVISTHCNYMGISNKREREMQRVPYIRQFQKYKNIEILNILLDRVSNTRENIRISDYR